MTQTAPEQGGHPRPPVGKAVAGVVLALIGSLTLSGLVWMANSGAPIAQKIMFDMGLALTSLVSAGAQALVFVGILLLWQAVHRPR